MRTWFAATGILSVVFVSACSGGASSSSSAGGSAPIVVPPTSQTYAVSTKQYNVNPSSGSAPSVTMNVISVPGLPANGGVAVAKDGALWWESPSVSGGEMVREQNNSVTTVPFSTGGPGTTMTSTPDGQVWGSSNSNDGQGSYFFNYFAATAGSSSVSHNTAVSAPPNMIDGPNGAMWFAGSFTNPPNSAGIFGNSAGLLQTFTSPVINFGPIAVSPDKMLWVIAQPSSPTEFYRYSTSGTLLGTVPISGNVTQLNDFVTGPDGALWGVGNDNENHALIARIDTSGHATIYPYTAGLNRITVGGDGALWFTDSAGNIGRITTSGSITLYPLPVHTSAGYQITGPQTSPGCGPSELFVSTIGGPIVQLIIKT